jgi:hypothetical protein
LPRAADRLSPTERKLRGRIAAHAMHAQHDPRDTTAKARAAFRDSFERQVPDEITDPAERARRAEHLRQAYYTQLAFRSAKARRQRKQQNADDGARKRRRPEPDHGRTRDLVTE